MAIRHFGYLKVVSKLFPRVGRKLRRRHLVTILVLAILGYLSISMETFNEERYVRPSNVIKEITGQFSKRDVQSFIVRNGNDSNNENYNTNVNKQQLEQQSIVVVNKPGLSAPDILQKKSGKCKLSEEEKKAYPSCMLKIEFLQGMWKTHACYKKFGIDGSNCSIIKYLSEVEEFCPRQPGSTIQLDGKKEVKKITHAVLNLDLPGLMEHLKDPNTRQAYAWIRLRITRMWNQWRKAAMHLVHTRNVRNRPKQKILLHLGLLTRDSGFGFAEGQFKGAPLGELVQWSDLISSLYILGHELKITSEVEQLDEILSDFNIPCLSHKDLSIDLIYTDITGLNQIKGRLKDNYLKFRCRFRILDDFGTEPAFNHQQFAEKNNKRSGWGGLNLNPLQFENMFPHTPDNTFLGFVVERLLPDDTTEMNNITKKNIALVYGKNDHYYQGKAKYLDVIHKYLQVHGTVFKGPNSELRNVPSYTINHGILTGFELHKLLQQSKIFVGLGTPFEGPAALEAIANGAVFLNPIFNPPVVYGGKPTERGVTSQNPYAETFIGHPYVYSVDLNNSTKVEEALKEILANQQIKPYLPFEYSEEGMLERVNAFVLNQNFCEHTKKTASRWPPKSALEFIVGTPGKSCKDICWEKKRICEPSYFPDLNTRAVLGNMTNNKCKSHGQASHIYYPAFDQETQVCITQGDNLLFSCVGGAPNLQRVCPCRDFIHGQTALCVGCEMGNL